MVGWTNSVDSMSYCIWNVGIEWRYQGIVSNALERIRGQILQPQTHIMNALFIRLTDKYYSCI